MMGTICEAIWLEVRLPPTDQGEHLTTTVQERCSSALASRERVESWLLVRSATRVRVVSPGAERGRLAQGTLDRGTVAFNLVPASLLLFSVILLRCL